LTHVYDEHNAMKKYGTLPEDADTCMQVDAHVHFYPCFNIDAFFNAARTNFGAGVCDLRLCESGLSYLLFTETPNTDYFEYFSNGIREHEVKHWHFIRTCEECSIIARHDDGYRLIIVAGRQIPTEEGLEILAIGTNDRFPVRMAIFQTFEAVKKNGAIPIVPYGFGKWWLRRGTLVKALIEAAEPGELFLGDNSGRTQIGRTPRLFGYALSRGIPTLPGSDPLPFPEQVGKVGGYGFVLSGMIDDSFPAKSLVRAIRNLTDQPVCFGRRESLAKFARYQTAMQLKKLCKGKLSCEHS